MRHLDTTSWTQESYSKVYGKFNREWQTPTGDCGPGKKKITFIGSIYLQLSEKGKGLFPRHKQNQTSRKGIEAVG